MNTFLQEILITGSCVKVLYDIIGKTMVKNGNGIIVCHTQFR